MSYGLITPCWNCSKNKECKDSLKLQDGVNKIHEKADEHKGCGNIVLMCAKVKPIIE